MYQAASTYDADEGSPMTEQPMNAAPKCFVYGLVDPSTRLVFYVGQSSVGLRRPRKHAAKGWVYEIAILESVDEPKAQVPSLCPWLPDGRNPTALHEAERWWIAYGRTCGWPLRNATDGGEGTRGSKRTPETIARMSAAIKEAWNDPAKRERMAAGGRTRIRSEAEIENARTLASRRRALSDEERRVVGEKLRVGWTPERRASFAAIKRGTVHSEETRKKIGALWKGKKRGPLSDEHRANLSAAQRRRFARPEERAKLIARVRNPSEETRAKMRASHLGRAPVLSKESREKQAAALRGRKLSPESIAKRQATRAARRAAKATSGD